MVWGHSIRRVLGFARRHGWGGAAILLFVGAIATGGEPVLAGGRAFLSRFDPGMAAKASDQPEHGVVHLAMTGFEPSRFAPQVLFPVTARLFPSWMRSKPVAVPAPAPASAKLAAAMPESAPALPAGPPATNLKPAIAICIDDLGEDLAGTDKAMTLPKEVALSFLPYADGTPFLAEEAEAKGHDVLAHVPMEALSGTNPGPMTLKAGEDNVQKLGWNISRVPGLKGVNNHEGSRFTEDVASLMPVMRVLAEKHLFFFDSRTIADTKGMAVARKAGVMSAQRDVFLDDEIGEAAIRQQLDVLVAKAKQNGTAIAIGHPHDTTLRVLTEWLARDHDVEVITLPEAIARKSLRMAMAE